MLQKILESRELRSAKQKELLGKFPFTLVSFTLNIPGPNKSSLLYTRIHEEGLRYLIKEIKTEKSAVKHLEVHPNITGMEAFLCVDLNSQALKEITIQIEDEHPLGRLFDFDVFDQAGKILNRTFLGKERRKCLLCKDDAVICSRSRKHSLEDLIEKIDQLGNGYFSIK